jgi:hypothetical protein
LQKITNLLRGLFDLIFPKFSESGRAHRDLNPLGIISIVYPFIESENKQQNILASCIITNLFRLNDSKSMSSLYNDKIFQENNPNPNQNNSSSFLQKAEENKQ